MANARSDMGFSAWTEVCFHFFSFSSVILMCPHLAEDDAESITVTITVMQTCKKHSAIVQILCLHCEKRLSIHTTAVCVCQNVRGPVSLQTRAVVCCVVVIFCLFCGKERSCTYAIKVSHIDDKLFSKYFTNLCPARKGCLKLVLLCHLVEKSLPSLAFVSIFALTFCGKFFPQ